MALIRVGRHTALHPLDAPPVRTRVSNSMGASLCPSRRGDLSLLLAESPFFHAVACGPLSETRRNIRYAWMGQLHRRYRDEVCGQALTCLRMSLSIGSSYNEVARISHVLNSHSHKCFILSNLKWWRRRESNPRPKARPRRTLHACLLLKSYARREEAAKNRPTPDPVNLTATRRAATWPPACLMASDPQPPGEVGADVTA